MEKQQQEEERGFFCLMGPSGSDKNEGERIVQLGELGVRS
jgi:hypothetical protein